MTKMLKKLLTFLDSKNEKMFCENAIDWMKKRKISDNYNEKKGRTPVR